MKMIKKVIYLFKPILKPLLKISFLNKVWWYINKPKLPDNEKKLLHLGCGNINVSGFINIDKLPYKNIHYLSGVEKLSFMKDNSADLIYMSHCLEHIPWNKVENALKEYYRILKKGGIIRLSVPNFETIIEMYTNRREITDIISPLMGGQDYKYNFHYTVFNKAYLTKLLIDSGFSEVKEWEFGDGKFKSLPDWSGREIKIDNKSYSISLNIEALK